MAAPNDQTKQDKIEKTYQKSRRLFPEVPEIDAAELRKRLPDQSIVLLDVRTPAEQAISMIPGALKAEEFESQADDFKDATIVTYCTIGHRSGLYAQQLINRGFDATNLKGAILSWTHCEGELENAEGPTRRVHVAKKQFALHAEGYEPVW